MSKKIKHLKHATFIAVFWNFLEQIFRRGITSITTVVLTWFLVPSDFGLIAMTTVFLAMANVLVDSGFKQALIRVVNPTDIYFSTAFTLNMLLAVIVYALIFFSAPLVATFYEQESLTLILRVLSISILFNAYTVVQESVLHRQMKFKLQFKITLPAAIISSLFAILFAYIGMGVWAIVLQSIIASFCILLAYLRLNLWQPKIAFDKDIFKELLGFGGFLTLQKLSNQPFIYMYLIVIAKTFPASVAGVYYFAEKIKDLLINQLVSAIQTVSYPALISVQSNPERLIAGYRKLASTVTFVFFPILIFLSILAENFFMLLPQSWWAASEIFQFMCVASLLYPLHLVSVNIMKIKGRADLVFYVGMLKNVITLAIFFMTYKYGIKWILIGQLLSSIICYIPSSYYSKKLIGYKYKDQLSDFIPSLLCAFVIGALLLSTKLLINDHFIFISIVLGLIAIFLYILIAHLISLRPYIFIKSLVLSKLQGLI